MSLLRGPYRGLIKPRFILGDFLQNVIPDYRTGWFMQEPDGSVALATNVAVLLGRRLNLLAYADYVAGAGWSNSGGQVATHAGGGGTATLSQAGVLAIGKTFRIITIVSGRTAGSVIITGTGAVAINANGTATDNITALGTALIYTPTDDFDGSIDVSLVVLQQTDIAASSAFSTPGDNPLDGTHSGIVLGASGNTQIPYMATYDGIAAYTDIYSAELNSVYNPSEQSLSAFVRVSNAGVWTDGVTRYIATLLVDATNYITLLKHPTNNQIQGWVNYNGTFRNVISGVLTSLDIMRVTITTSATSGNVSLLINGVLAQTKTGASTIVGNLSATGCVIGAASTTPTNVWSGGIAYVSYYGAAISEAEDLRCAIAAGVA